MRCNLAFVVLLVFASVSPGCGSSAPANDDEPATTTGGDNTPSDTPPTGNNNPPPGPGSTTLLSVVPNNATPAGGGDVARGLHRELTLAQMQAFYATMVSVNDTIWQISEGQVRIHEIKFFDSVAPGVSASQYAFAGTGIDVSNLDIVIWPPQQWDIPFGGAVSDQAGRNGRHAIMPANVSTFVATHEGGHFLFKPELERGAAARGRIPGRQPGPGLRHGEREPAASLVRRAQPRQPVVAAPLVLGADPRGLSQLHAPRKRHGLDDARRTDRYVQRRTVVGFVY